jgi:hypothetical protein
VLALRRVLKWVAILIGVPVVVLLGFLWAIWGPRTLYQSVSPYGETRVNVVETACLGDCAVSVVVSEKWWQRSQEIAAGTDCWIMFAHVAWVDSVAVTFIDGTFCGAIETAYDSKRHQSVKFAPYKEALAKSIVAEYGVTPSELAQFGGDVFKWATYPGDGSSPRSSVEFRRRHPR